MVTKVFIQYTSTVLDQMSKTRVGTCIFNHYILKNSYSVFFDSAIAKV